jgi:hypothetical protein
MSATIRTEINQTPPAHPIQLTTVIGRQSLIPVLTLCAQERRWFVSSTGGRSHRPTTRRIRRSSSSAPTFARQQWGSANPLGQRVRVAFSSTPIGREVVGVVADVHDAGLDQPTAPAIYVPYAQAPLGGIVFVIETAVAPRNLLARVRRELGAVNGAMPIASAATLDELWPASRPTSPRGALPGSMPWSRFANNPPPIVPDTIGS